MLIKILLNIFLLITAIPVGYFLAWLCKDELVDGRKWFKIILVCLFVCLVLFLIFFRNMNAILSVSYMIIVTFIAFMKGQDKKFVGK